jgi:hypothetical protein
MSPHCELIRAMIPAAQHLIPGSNAFTQQHAIHGDRVKTCTIPCSGQTDLSRLVSSAVVRRASLAPPANDVKSAHRSSPRDARNFKSVIYQRPRRAGPSACDLKAMMVLVGR